MDHLWIKRTDSVLPDATGIYPALDLKILGFVVQKVKKEKELIRHRGGLPVFRIHCIAEFYELHRSLTFFLFFATSEDD